VKILGILILIWGCAQTERATETKKVSYQAKPTVTYRATSDSYSVDSIEANALLRETLAKSEGRIIRDFTDDPDSGIGALCYDGDFSKAFSLADKNYSSYKKNPGYWNQIGNCYYLRKDYKKAILFYNKAKGLNPNFTPALNNLGVVFQTQGDFKKALFFYKSAVNLSAAAKTPRFNLANIYLKFGIVNKACSLFNALSGSSPMDVDILNAKATCALFNRNYALAVSEFKKIPSDELSKGHIGINYALALGIMGKKGEALDRYSDISQKDLGPLKNYYRNVGDYLNRM
jgi:tetratricopeptide (TPR) repeat protein